MIPIKEIIVNDKMQRNYTYVLSENVGDNFHIDFKPEDVISKLEDIFH